MDPLDPKLAARNAVEAVWIPLKLKIGLTGIEPALIAELDPKSSASASSATAPSDRLVQPSDQSFSLLLAQLVSAIASDHLVHRLEAYATVFTGWKPMPLSSQAGSLCHC